MTSSGTGSAGTGAWGSGSSSTAARAGPTTLVALPARSTSVGEARRFVAAGLADVGLHEEVVETAVLLTSEVVTNAIVHCSTEVQLRLTADDSTGALIEVLDACSLVPLQREPDPDSVAGRGLAMVELLSTAYGTVPVECGKVVWFTVGDTDDLDLPGAPGWVPADARCGPDGRVRIRLRGVPVGLFDAMREHNESLLREYQIHLLDALSDADPSDGVAAHAREDLVLVAHARGQVASAVQQAVRAAGPAADDPSARVDVSLSLDTEDAAACAALPSVLDRAETVARSGRFLTRPALPEMLSLRDWLYPEVAAQANGAEPSAWSAGTLVEPPLVAAAGGDLRWVAATDRALVVADRDNRILAVSGAAADLLGWSRDELAGQRLTTIIPPVLREAHVTGFSRHVTTGQPRVLGTVLDVPALHRDGRLVKIRLRIEQDVTGPDPLYLGWLEPADREPVDREPVDREPVDREPVDRAP